MPVSIDKIYEPPARCKCGSWLLHWEKYNPYGHLAVKCSVINCDNEELEGAHVQLARRADDTCYVIPLCTSHNKPGNKVNLQIYSATELIKADRASTCESEDKQNENGESNLDSPSIL